MDNTGARIIAFPRRGSTFPRQLTSPPIIDHWRLVESGPGPYIIEGTIDGRPFRDIVFALTLTSGGVALLRDRRLALGMPDPGGLAVIDEDAVIGRAAAWIRGDVS